MSMQPAWGRLGAAATLLEGMALELELLLTIGHVTCVVTVWLVLFEALESLDVLTVATFWMETGAHVCTAGSVKATWKDRVAPGLSVKLLQRTELCVPFTTQLVLEP